MTLVDIGCKDKEEKKNSVLEYAITQSMKTKSQAYKTVYAIQLIRIIIISVAVITITIMFCIQLEFGA